MKVSPNRNKQQNFLEPIVVFALPLYTEDEKEPKPSQEARIEAEPKKHHKLPQKTARKKKATSRNGKKKAKQRAEVLSSMKESGVQSRAVEE